MEPPNLQHLFLFTIGPVQSFIAQARKTQDLYAGSHILSQLIKEAIKTIGRNNILFPYAYPQNDEKWKAIESLPNRLLALVEADDLRGLGERVEQNVRKKWLEIARQPINDLLHQQIKNGEAVKFDIAGINQQLEQHLEIFWLFEPLNDYGTSYKNIEQNLGAIKNVRSFQQFTYNGIGERGRKCSLDGQRNAYFFGAGTNQNYLKKWNPYAIELKDKYFRVPKNEGLSAVSFAKRFYQKEKNQKENFPSTAKIALFHLWQEQEIKQVIEKNRNDFGNEFDEELLFEENINETYFKKHQISIERLAAASIYQKEMMQLAKNKDLKATKYYALLSFDGDNMGEWLSKAENEQQHKDFSKLLMDFAQKAKIIVDKNGKTVYAGGDDFLGFVNLQYLFETIEQLKEVFERDVTKEVKLNNGSKQFTISIGVVIAHYKMPLQKVIQLNREILKNTKERFRKAKDDFSFEKNGIGICYTTSSTILGKTYVNDLEDLILLKQLTNYFINKKLSPSILVKYHSSISTIIGGKHDFDGYLTQISILKVELKRLISRTSTKDTRKDILKHLVAKQEHGLITEKGLSKLLQKQVREISTNRYEIDIENLFSFMKIAIKLSANYLKPIPNVVSVNQTT